MDNFFHYISEKTQAENWGVHVPTCGYQHIYPGNPYPLEEHPKTHTLDEETGRILPGCYLIYITTGRGIFETKENKWDVNPGDLIVLAPEEWHNYRPSKNTGWEEYWIGIRGEFFSNKIINDLFPDEKSYVKHIGYQEDVIFLFNQALELVKRNKPGFRKILAGVVLQLFAYIISFEEKNIGNREEQLASQVVEFIRQNLNTEIDFKQLAGDHLLSYNRFRTIFKNNTGISLQQYLINERLENAKRLIINSNLSLKEIAAKTGFNSLFYFSKVFKNKMGYPPNQIRR